MATRLLCVVVFLVLFASTVLAQQISFTSWRPYNRPDRVLTVGMNKGEVISIAGQADFTESYYRSIGRLIIRISDWYYTRTGINAETTLLKFREDSLVRIISTPTQ